MAHFAKLNDDNIVEQIIVVANEELLKDDVESEQKGIEFCQSLFGEDSRWIQTSYSGSFRKRYAGVGDFYDEMRDIFYAPKLFASWIFDEQKGEFVAPIPYPTDGAYYEWNEAEGEWNVIS